MAQAPVAADADPGARIPQVAAAQRLQGARVVPAHGLGQGGLGAYARDLGKRLAQLGAHARGVVLQVLGRPLGAGLHGPALDLAARGLGGLARQPGDAVVRAARGVPLRAQRGQPRAHGLGKGEQQGPAGRHLDLRQGPCQVRRQGGAAGAGGEQAPCGLCGQGQQHGVETGKDLLRAVVGQGVQLPAPGVQAVALQAGNAGARVQALRGGERLGPGLGQAGHAGPGHPVRLARHRAGGDHAARGVEHAHGVHAPGAAQAGHGLQRPGKACVAHGEVLRAQVEAAKRRLACGHAAARGGLLLEDRDAVPGLQQRAGAGDAGHAGADHCQVARRLCRGADGGRAAARCGRWCGGGHGRVFPGLRSGVCGGSTLHARRGPGAANALRNGGGFPAGRGA